MIDIEDIYPLSPLQKGLLFHTLYAPESAAYFEQFSCKLSGRLEVKSFQRAWQRVVDRHAVLRTSFNWESLDRPLQVVRRGVTLAWDWQDWQELPEADQRARLEAFLAADRKRGFALHQPPLLRMALIKASDDAHYFVWSHHHLLLDGWSSPVLLGEVFAFYDALCEGRELLLPAPRPYRDYIAWVERQDLAPVEVYWRRALEGFQEPTSLRVERGQNRFNALEPDYGVRQARISEQITRLLSLLGQKHRLTLHTIVQGSWALLLSRYSGQSDVVFGTTVSGRNPDILGVDSIVGLLINTLPTRVQLRSGEWIIPWFQRLQDQEAEARQYDYAPLMDIQKWSDVSRGTSLFETLFVFENYPRDPTGVDRNVALRRRGLEISQACAFERTNYPLTAIVGPGSELVLQLAYETQHFEAATIERMLDHWKNLLEGIAANPERRIGDPPLLSEAEHRQVVVEWNRTQAGDPRQLCAHAWFAEKVEHTPDWIAVEGDGKLLTYRELNRRANQLAHHLREAGVGPEVRVAICLQRSPEMVVAILAVLKAGGAYVPLDPAYPKERLAFMIRDAQVSLLLTQARLRSVLPQCGGAVVFLDDDAVAIASEDEGNPVATAALDNLAYVVYTSGSTGQPKGVMMTHRCLCNLLGWQLQDPSFSPRGRTLQFTSICFDVSFQEIFSTWLSGGTLVMIPDEVRCDSARLRRFLGEHRIERLFLPYIPLRELAEVTDREESFPVSLREVITAGEQLRVTSGLTSWFRRLGGCTLQNQYGPSESHVVTAFRLEGTPEDWPVLPPIGRPISNSRIYVLDSELRPVPIGVPGELHIGGTSLARGYLDRPDSTAERFIPDPFGDERGARLYKTGDLARFRPDGSLEYLGRIDQQVKIRGFRVEPGEVEAALSQHSGVRQVAVVANRQETGDQRLVAHVVGGPGAAPSIGELRSFLSAKLPDYLVPAFFIFHDALPLSRNGKVDRRALPAPDSARPQLEQTFVVPDTPIQRVLAGIWSEVLAVEKLGIHDNFFELGGDSILALRVIAQVRALFQVEVPVRVLFDEKTIAGMAGALGRDTNEGAELEQIAELALSVSQLSEAEVETLLAERAS
jgi:amino acid adenylation domain-containing protein